MIKFINDGSDESDNDGKNVHLGSLSLLVLINLCYKNVNILYSLLRLINFAEFIKKIKIYDILSSKFLMIVDHHTNTASIDSLKYFLKQSFIKIEQYLKDFNDVFIRHIVDILIDQEFISEAVIKEYQDLFIDIEKILNVS